MRKVKESSIVDVLMDEIQVILEEKERAAGGDAADGA